MPDRLELGNVAAATLWITGSRTLGRCDAAIVLVLIAASHYIKLMGHGSELHRFGGGP